MFGNIIIRVSDRASHKTRRWQQKKERGMSSQRYTENRVGFSKEQDAKQHHQTPGNNHYTWKGDNNSSPPDATVPVKQGQGLRSPLGGEINDVHPAVDFANNNNNNNLTGGPSHGCVGFSAWTACKSNQNSDSGTLFSSRDSPADSGSSMAGGGLRRCSSDSSSRQVEIAPPIRLVPSFRHKLGIGVLTPVVLVDYSSCEGSTIPSVATARYKFYCYRLKLEV